MILASPGRCLVLGASGFLGSRLLDLGAGWHTVGTALAHLRPGLLSLDLTEVDDVDHCLTDVRPDLILYAAGVTSVDLCETMPEKAEYLNHEVPSMLARRRACRMVYVSTDYVFDGQRGRYSEDDPPSPINVYGASKMRGELAILTAHHANIVVRVSGLFDSEGTREGRFPRHGDGVADRADENRFSSPVHVEDVRRALCALLSTNASGIFHAGGHEVLSRYAFRQTVARHKATVISPLATTYRIHDHLARRPLDTSLSSLRLANLGWRPRKVEAWFSSGTPAIGN